MKRQRIIDENSMNFILSKDLLQAVLVLSELVEVLHRRKSLNLCPIIEIYVIRFITGVRKVITLSIAEV